LGTLIFNPILTQIQLTELIWWVLDPSHQMQDPSAFDATIAEFQSSKLARTTGQWEQYLHPIIP
jgi:hypothetical protein